MPELGTAEAARQAGVTIVPEAEARQILEAQRLAEATPKALGQNDRTVRTEMHERAMHSTPAYLRQIAREQLRSVVHVATDVANGTIGRDTLLTCPACSVKFRAEVPAPRDRVAGLDTLTRIGMPQQTEMSLVSDDVRSRLAAQVTLMQSRTTWDSTELLSELDAIWQ